MYRYVSYLEIEKLRQFLQEISDNFKIEQISIPEEKLKEADFIEPVQETLERIKELSNEMVKNRIFSQINRYLNDLLTQNKVYSLDGPISYISKRKLEDLLINFSIDYENNRYKNASFLKKYGDELDLILQNLGADEFAKFIRMLGELIDLGKEKDYYSYEGVQSYIIKFGEAARVFKNSNYSATDIESFVKKIEEIPLKFLIKFKHKIFLDKREKKVYNNENEVYKNKNDLNQEENVCLLPVYLVDSGKGILFEVISYLYLRKILNEVGLLFLSTHNLSLEWKEIVEGNEITIRKEIDIPIVLFYENTHIFIPIECKFTYPSNDDIHKLVKMKEKLNSLPINNEICILTADSNIALDEKEGINIVPISKFREWVKELIEKF